MDSDIPQHTGRYARVFQRHPSAPGCIRACPKIPLDGGDTSSRDSGVPWEGLYKDIPTPQYTLILHLCVRPRLNGVLFTLLRNCHPNNIRQIWSSCPRPEHPRSFQTAPGAPPHKSPRVVEPCSGAPAQIKSTLQHLT